MYMARTHILSDLAAVDTLPTVFELNSGLLTYFSIFRKAVSEMLSLSCSISSFKNDGLPIQRRKIYIRI